MSRKTLGKIFALAAGLVIFGALTNLLRESASDRVGIQAVVPEMIQCESDWQFELKFQNGSSQAIRIVGESA